MNLLPNSVYQYQGQLNINFQIGTSRATAYTGFIFHQSQNPYVIMTLKYTEASGLPVRNFIDFFHQRYYDCSSGHKHGKAVSFLFPLAILKAMA